jgi:CheY-specific phosphatase CheX
MQNLSNALRESACETLENLAFTELAPEPEARLPEARERLCACIGLGHDGSLDVVLSRPLLSEIASILFNLDAGEIDASTLDDTLMEIANIIAGRYLEKVHEGSSDFILGLPRVCADAVGWEALPVRLSLASGPDRLLALGLRAESGAAG